MNEPIDTTTSEPSAPSGGDAAPTSVAPDSGAQTSTSATPGESGSEAPPSPENPRTEEAKSQPSLTTPKSDASTAQPGSDELKKLRDSLSERGRQMSVMQKQYEAQRQQMAELQKFREEQMEKAKQSNLRRWDHRHPDHGKFNSLLEKAALVRQQLSAIRAPDTLTDPNQRQAWEAASKQAVLSALGEDEQRELQEYQSSVQEFQRGFLSNPVGALTQHVQPMIRQEMENYFREQNMRSQVQRDLSDPGFKPLVEKYGDDIKRAMDEGVPYEHAVHYTKVFGAYNSAMDEVAQLKQQIQELTGKAQSADVQADLAKGKASITRDRAAPAKGSIFTRAKAIAQKEGVDMSSTRFAQIVDRLTQEEAKSGSLPTFPKR